MAIGSRRKQAVATTPDGRPALPAPPASMVPVPPTTSAPLSARNPPALPALVPPPVPSSADAPAVAAAGVEVADLKAAVGDLQALVASLVDRPAPPSDAPDAASRIIVAANEAAEAAVAGARAEAEQVVATAKAKCFEIIGVARDLADSELTAERNRVAAATDAWNASRATITEHLGRLESSLTTYRSDLTDAAAAISAAIARLEDVSIIEAPELVPAEREGDSAVADATDAAPEAAASETEVDGAEGVEVSSNAAAGDLSDEAPPTSPPAAVFGIPAPSAPPVPGPGEAPKRSMLFGNGVSQPAKSAAPADPSTPRLRAGVFGR